VVKVLIVDTKVRSKMDVGHTAIQIGNVVYGFYPMDENGNGIYGKSELLNSKGFMDKENIDKFNEQYLEDGITAITLNVSEAQANLITQNLEAIKKNPENYSLATTQCTSVACGALVNSKIDIQVFHSNHGDPGPSPITQIYTMSPTAFKEILLNGLNPVQSVEHYGGK
jgi:hypothetical protein